MADVIHMRPIDNPKTFAERILYAMAEGAAKGIRRYCEAFNVPVFVAQARFLQQLNEALERRDHAS